MKRSAWVKVTNLREPKMADRVANELRRQFIKGDLPEGTMLPSEAELMQQFGVSRPTLREALRVLESESLIVVLRGVNGGAKVSRPERATLARYAGLIMEYEDVTLKDVYEARTAIETPMVMALATKRPKRAIAELEEIVRRERLASPGQEAIDAHTEFHAAIARLSGNKSLQIVSEMFHHIVARANRSLQPTTGPEAERALRRSSKTHEVVLDLIRAGDAEAAAALWGRHLRKAEEYVLNGVEASTVLDLVD